MRRRLLAPAGATLLMVHLAASGWAQSAAEPYTGTELGEVARTREWLESTPTRVPLLWLPAGDCGVDPVLDVLTVVCGYESIALNDDGSRILAIDFGGKIRLFDDSGQLLAEHATATDTRGTSATPFFDGERAAALIGGRLVTLDAATGEALIDRVVVRVCCSSSTSVRGVDGPRERASREGGSRRARCSRAITRAE